VPYVDLDRCFVPISRNAEPDFDLGPAWGRRIGGWIAWSRLLDHRLVAVLAEAASGKTAEFRHAATALRDTGKVAFFVAIEQLAAIGLAAALGPTEVQLLEKWRAGRDDAWFFLDSVDEARLNHRSLESGLRQFTRELDLSLRRARVLVSCRVSDWKEPEDRTSLERILAVPPGPPVTALPRDADAALLAPIFDRRTASKSATPSNFDKTELLVVRLIPLSDSQRRVLAAASGVVDAHAFVTAINRHGLEALADRPGDVLDLGAYWQDRGNFGTFAEMTEYSVGHKLAELDKFRPDNADLPSQKARQGAERIAAGLTLGKSFTLLAPGHVPDPTLAPGAVDPAAVLGEWTDAERNALIRRGLFAPATYGRIRFHHRSAQEYLTAAWLNRLLAQGCSSSEIFRLLFADRYGVKTVVPSLRPAAAWLALWRADIRDELIRREPLVLLRHGDPSHFPLETKQRLLITLAHRHASGEIADDSIDARILWMFTSPELAATIREAWTINTRSDFHADLLRIVGAGRIQACVDLAQLVACSEHENDYHRIVALDAIKECGAGTALNAVAEFLMSGLSHASERLASGFAVLLFPQHLSVGRLVELIARAKPSKGRGFHGFPHSIDRLWNACVSVDMRKELLRGLTDICSQAPHVHEHRRISRRHFELAERLASIARSAISELGDSDPSETLVRFLAVVERTAQQTTPEEADSPLSELVSRNTRLKRALFWHDVEEQRCDGRELTRVWQIDVGHSRLWRLTLADLQWLYSDLAGRRLEGDRRIALNAVYFILMGQKLLKREARALRRRCSVDPTLNEDLDEYLAAPSKDESLRRDRADERRRESARRRQEKSAKASWLRFRTDLQADPFRMRDPSQVASGPVIWRFWNLRTWLARRAGEDEGASRRWRLLEDGFGLPVAEAYRDGLKALWRIIEPERTVRRLDGARDVKGTTVLACVGLDIESHADPNWAATLTSQEAVRAARHGCLGGQGYPHWIEALVDLHPAVVLPIVREVIREEWTSEQIASESFLYHYAHPTTPAHRGIQTEAVRVIGDHEPKNLRVLEYGLRILQMASLNVEQRSMFGGMARRKFRERARRSPEWAIRYIALLFLMDAEEAIKVLLAWLQRAEAETVQGKPLAWVALRALFGQRDPLVPLSRVSVSVGGLEELLLLSYRAVRLEDDNVRNGVYEPNVRDDAEAARGEILRVLRQTPGPGAYAAMMRVSARREVRGLQMRWRECAREMAERDAEVPAWTALEVLALEVRHHLPVKTGLDLFLLVCAVVDEIRESFAGADASSREVVETARDEDAVQKWLAEQLRLRGRGRYHVHREAEVADANLPDILVSAVGALFEVAVELKHGGRRWTLTSLEASLRSQLVRDYLKPDYRRHGLLVITHHREKTWRHPETQRRLSFDEVIDHLSIVASTLTRNEKGSIEVVVKGIDAARGAFRGRRVKAVRERGSRRSGRNLRATPRRRR
jgi:hypothetical protein